MTPAVYICDYFDNSVHSSKLSQSFSVTSQDILKIHVHSHAYIFFFARSLSTIVSHTILIHKIKMVGIFTMSLN